MDTNTASAPNGAATGNGMDALAALFTEKDLGGAPREPEPQPQQRQAPEPEDDTREATADDGDEASLEFADDSEDQVEPDEANDDIPAPAGMGADDLALWAKMPAEAKRFLAAQEARRTADYTRKTTEAAQQRQEAEQLKQAWGARVQEQLQVLGQLARADIQPPNPKLADEDPFEFARQLGQYNVAQREQEMARQEHARLTHELTVQHEADYSAYVQEEQEKLLKDVPALADPVKGPQLARDIGAYAMSVGVKSEQLKKASALELKVLHKAMLYDRAVTKAKQAGQKTTQGKPSPTAPSGRLGGPGAASGQRLQSIKQAHQKEGSVKSMANIWGEFLKGT